MAGQFSFAHVALAGLAGYGGAIWGNLWAPVHPLLGSVGVQILVGTLVAWVVGSLLGLLLLRLRAAYLALFTIAFAEIAVVGDRGRSPVDGRAPLPAGDGAAGV